MLDQPQSSPAGVHSMPFLLDTAVLCCAKSLQSCLTMCDPMDHSPPGSSVHGILQARILEWVPVPFSRGIFQTHRWNPPLLHLLLWQVGPLPLAPPGKPLLDATSCEMGNLLTNVLFFPAAPLPKSLSGKIPQ